MFWGGFFFFAISSFLKIKGRNKARNYGRLFCNRDCRTVGSPTGFSAPNPLAEKQVVKAVRATELHLRREASIAKNTRVPLRGQMLAQPRTLPPSIHFFQHTLLAASCLSCTDSMEGKWGLESPAPGGCHRHFTSLITGWVLKHKSHEWKTKLV